MYSELTYSVGLDGLTLLHVPLSYGTVLEVESIRLPADFSNNRLVISRQKDKSVQSIASPYPESRIVLLKVRSA